jgi:hypothetical protein
MTELDRQHDGGLIRNELTERQVDEIERENARDAMGAELVDGRLTLEQVAADLRRLDIYGSLLPFEKVRELARRCEALAAEMGALANAKR